MNNWLRLIALALVLTGCSAGTPAPVDKEVCSDRDPLKKDGGIGGTGNTHCEGETTPED